MSMPAKHDAPTAGKDLTDKSIPAIDLMQGAWIRAELPALVTDELPCSGERNSSNVEKEEREVPSKFHRKRPSPGAREAGGVLAAGARGQPLREAQLGARAGRPPPCNPPFDD